MSVLTFLGIGKQAGDALASPIEAIGDVFDKLFTSDDERANAAFVLEKLRQHPSELQVGLNKVEAQHRSVFVAGWRPALGWVLVLSLGIYYIPQFAIASYLWVWACLEASKVVPYPVTQISGLLELMGGMLGLATLRTVEKLTGKTK